MAKRAAAKTSGKLPELVPQPHGGALLSGGIPGHPGYGGRPPDEFKLLLGSLIDRASTIKALAAILEDDKHPLFMRAYEYAADRRYPELANAVKAAQVTVNNNVQQVNVWRFGDRTIEFK